MISAAIVVLIMAAIGAPVDRLQGMWEDIESDTNDRIEEVGN